MLRLSASERGRLQMSMKESVQLPRSMIWHRQIEMKKKTREIDVCLYMYKLLDQVNSSQSLIRHFQQIVIPQHNQQKPIVACYYLFKIFQLRTTYYILHYQQMFWQIILYSTIAIILYFAFRFIVKPYYRMQQYKKIPGVGVTRFIPFFGYMQLYAESFEKYDNEFYEINQIMRNHPERRATVFNMSDVLVISINDPTLIKELIKNQDKYVKHPIFVNNQRRIFGPGTAFTEGKDWVKKRKITSSIFHFQFYQNFIPKLNAIIDRQIKIIKDRKDNKMEATQLSYTLSGDSIIQLFFGFSSFTDKIKGLSMPMFMSKLVADSLKQTTGLRTIFGQGILKYGICQEDREMNENIRIFREIIKQAIEKKMSSEAQRKTSLFLEEIFKKNLYNTEQGLNSEELVYEFTNLYMAGTDASALHASMCFYYLSIYPEIQEKLRNQIKQSKILDNFEIKAISNMKYLDYFVKEVFRHYNFMGSPTPRTTTEDHYLGDLKICKGDVIALGGTEQNYNPVYYPDPDTFDPERWAKLNQKELSFVFYPFSIGHRNCFGQNFAILEIKIILCRMVSTFKYTLAPGYRHQLNFLSFHAPINPIIIDLEEL